MAARRIELQFKPRDQCWHATTVVRGARYCVRGRNRNNVFFDLCRMLHLPADSWRIILLDDHHYICTEIVRELPRADLPSTAELRGDPLRNHDPKAHSAEIAP